MSALIICVTDCSGYRPSAMDPLAQMYCSCHVVHCPHDGVSCPCYKPQLIDHVVASNVLRLYDSKIYNQMWGLDDDPEPWDEEIL
jgi:hypothetical protein